MLRGRVSDPPTIRAKEDGPTRSSPPSSYGAKVSNFVKIADKVETSSRELNMHFTRISCFTSMDGEGFARDSPLGSLNNSGAVTNLGEVGTGFVTRTEQVSEIGREIDMYK